MEDDNIKKLFADYNPPVSSNVRFISALKSKMNSVEIIRQHTAERRRRIKIALTISALSGFAVGVILTLLLPYITAFLAEWHPQIPDMVTAFNMTFNISFVRTFIEHLSIIVWTLAGVITLLATLQTYSLSMSLLRSRTNENGN